MQKLKEFITGKPTLRTTLKGVFRKRRKWHQIEMWIYSSAAQPGVDLPLQTLVISGESFGCHTLEVKEGGRLLVSSGRRPGKLLNILWHTGLPPTALHKNMSVVKRLKKLLYKRRNYVCKCKYFSYYLNLFQRLLVI